MTYSASIIVPSLGRAERLCECIGAILRQDKETLLDVVVVIDGPDAPQVMSEVRSRFPPETKIKFDMSPTRRGSPSAKNIGAAIAKGDILVFVDDDTVPTDGWLSAIVNAYSEGVVGVGGSEEKSAGAGVLRKTWIRFWGNATGKVTKSGLVISNFTPLKSSTESVGCLAGANMSFLKKEFEEIGGFDTAFRGTAYREETDLCLRIKKRGVLLFVPSATVLHHEEQRGGNTAESVRDWNYWYHRNNTYFFLKNLDGNSSMQWLLHQLLETVIAFGRVFQQRSLSALVTLRPASRDGRAVYDELASSEGLR